MSDITIRELKRTDLFCGFLDSLDSLRKTSDISPAIAEKIYDKIRSNPNHIILVAAADGIVGTLTLLIEPKFIHNGGMVGHIEDVSVKKDFQGQNIGKKLVLKSLEYAKDAGCYKTILECSDDIKPFYEKLGFKRHSDAMRFDH